MDVDAATAAALLHRSYDWFLENWRDLRAREGFPSPFVGDRKGGRAWWRRDDIEAWKARRAAGQTTATPGDFTQREATGPAVPAPANDPLPHRPKGRAAKLLAAAGGL